MIIIFTIKYDISTSNVIQWLQYFNQEVVRINSDDNIFKLVSIEENEILFKNSITNKVYNLFDAKSCWWRRNGISKNTFTNYINEKLIFDNLNLTSLIKGSGNILIEETEHLKEYIYAKIYENCKINIGKPLFNLNKLKVLDIAKKNGLKVPKYKIFTNTKQVLELQSVTKAISNGIYKIITNNSFYSYTEKLDLSKLKNKSIDIFPSLQMELIEKKLEVRCFFIDGHFFSMAIFSQSSEQTKIDFRKYNNIKPNKTEPFLLPFEIENKLKNTFKDLNLNCGSIDLIIDNDDNYFFLEINPVGQYGMVSDPCNYDLDKLIAKYLINGEIKIN
jgi:ATP-GRASP peptide maturase of grasp-with-spasm system